MTRWLRKGILLRNLRFAFGHSHSIPSQVAKLFILSLLFRKEFDSQVSGINKNTTIRYGIVTVHILHHKIPHHILTILFNQYLRVFYPIQSS